MKSYIPKFRANAKSLKEFYSLSKEEKKLYINELLQIPVDDRGDTDLYILNFYTDNQEENKKFISMDI